MPRRRLSPLPLLDLIWPVWMNAFTVLPQLFALNYLWDGVVLTVTAGRDARRALGPWRLARETLFACAVGFAVDMVSAALLLVADEGLQIHRHAIRDGHPAHWTEFGAGPFAVHALTVAAAALLIGYLDRRLLARRSLGLPPETAARVARRLAWLTAPYLLLFPAYF